MTLEDITGKFQEQMKNAPNIGKTLKFVFEEGAVFVDLTKDTPEISNENQDADCTITTKIDTLQKVIKGETNPMTAVMMGKIKIKGDMSIAMQLKNLLS